MSVTQAQANFINASHFAVIGRVLSDRSRWDNKVSPSLPSLGLLALSFVFTRLSLESDIITTPLSFEL